MKTHRVVIVDDDTALVKALKTRCGQLGLEAIGVCDGAEALSTIGRMMPDLVMLDINMPGSDGVSVCTALAANTHLAPIPVIVLSGRSDEETIHRCRELGAHFVIKSADVWSWLRPLIGKLLEIPTAESQTPARPPWDTDEETAAPTVLIIDDDADFCRGLQMRLAARGISVTHAQTGMQGYWAALRNRPCLIICDYDMPEGRGDYVVARLRQHSLTRGVPILMLTGWRRESLKDFGLEREMNNLGIKKFLMKPVDFDVLVDEIHKAASAALYPCSLLPERIEQSSAALT